MKSREGSAATRQPERPNPARITRSAFLDVVADVPNRAVVGRVDRGLRVVLPTHHGLRVLAFGVPAIHLNRVQFGIGNDPAVSAAWTNATIPDDRVTQHNTRSTWKYVPAQDFTTASDIDWSKPIPEIDQQLYAKYGLDSEEIAFLEAKVEPME